MTGAGRPIQLSPVDALELVARRREPIRPRSTVAGFFVLVPTALERWNSVPGAVKVVERDPSADGVPVVVAEPVEGTPLSQVMRRARVLDLDRAIHLALELGEILESLHDVGLVHGSLGADTVLVVGDGDDERVLLLPPPLAARPERGDRPDTRDAERADLLAFGNVLYDLLAGDEPSSRADRSVAAAAREAAPMPIGKRRRGLAPPLERLVMETLRADRAQLDVSEVVNLLWIERERLRGHPRRGPARRTGEFRRLAAVAAVATFVTLSWLNTTRSPAPPAPTGRPLAPAGIPAPRIASPPALPAETPDREAPRDPSLAGAVVATPPRVPAGTPARTLAPRPATSRPVPREVLERITIEPPPPPPAPPPSTPAEPSPTAVASVPAPEAAVGPAAPSPAPVAPTVTASQRPGELAEPSPATPAPPAVREAEAPKREPLDPLPEVAVVPMPPPAPADAPPAAPRVMLVRGAPGPGSEAGPSALSTGYGARGAAGAIQGRLGPVVRNGEPRSRSGLAAAAGFPAEPGDLRQGR